MEMRPASGTNPHDPRTVAETWPVVRRYRGRDLAHIAMPVGGVGTGCISLGGRGQLRDWELFNRPAKGFTPDTFFALHVSDSAPGTPGTPGTTRVLEAALLAEEYAGGHGSRSALHGLPRFRHGEFAAAYPFGQVRLTDPELPVEAVVSAYNPLIPGDADASGLPLLVYRVRVRNTGGAPLEVSLCGSLQHVAGRRPTGEVPAGNRFELSREGDVTMLAGGCGEAVAEDDEAWGSLALAAVGTPVTSHRRTWADRSWGDSLLEFWDDFGDDGRLDEPAAPDEGARVPTGSLVVGASLPPGGEAEFTFLIAWHFPNRRAWTHRPAPAPVHGHGGPVVGNHYALRFADAAEVVRRAVPELAAYERRTRAYVETVTGSDLPVSVQDAVLSNAAVLKSPTCFRIADGTFLAWEGTNENHGSCHGSCTHVWNYQYALEQLFPDLAWTMREVEFVHSLDERGMMSFRAGLPLATEGTGWRTAAADGQMGALVRLYRTWQLTGRNDLLARHWPAARRALEFAWIPLGWDADRDGLMEGCQHSTSDVEYYGPSGVNQSWYLAALAACARMAEAVGDTGFAATCLRVLRSGAAKTDAELFNGEYYEHRVLPAGSADRIAEGLRIRYADGDNPDVGSDDLMDPDLQIGPGCMADQLAGHALALSCGLDDRLDRAHTATALDSIVRHNHRAGFHGHFNHLRTYALGDEHGLLNCTYPHGGRPERPFPYCNEVWTGVEYTAAVALAAHGERERAEHVVADVRARYSGRTRNPFDEVECGHHYVRSMASFGLAHAWSRTVVDATARTIELDPLPGRWPVIAGARLGVVEVTARADGPAARLVGADGPEPFTVVLRPG
ncbi:GH116 family glycosyl-hydrolase [Streptomyces johnsoniae]|uniref:GH116 family glycosyl-hydrolase n=1 Tax=Streptomyces johnsoniae TaxID=3075532 RepID=A0ABU2S4Y5_9ACTN|nr:GH116 family glycosyl-hydrolase [Streptomyces sp. DSM 41886]MDT0443494.1 GH116 family glycosyl-hydrolase [Streptomyces sp. DSM 41886]